ncbi:SMP-30/gluconolactonase/LRE family protein [Limnohabitans lacus]|uniref:SMP-30/gluconolactonase/LRE family protein n=1 Tax=Limnohabitans lacus TaxID=3045173 RepID=A0ABT6X2M7_9BURK|nr:SMP-30/gluconolactonase/LRE family protein [Limnohabitans sp. HM2-2]MDI9232375.1 SMP-30/gluconolactonase/LRE family protein [Limnohabitans sp. HM2-2]
MNDFQTIADTQDRVGESPVWDVRAQRLWWVDIEGAFIRSTVLDAAEGVQSWSMPERVGCIALTPVQGQLIAAMESGIARVSLQADGQVDTDWLARIQHPAPGMRFNDGRCDASGRLWVGTMVMDMSLASDLGGLYCLDERGLTGPHVTGLLTPNGLGFSPDGRTLYLSDSHPTVQKIWAFDLDAATGHLRNQRLFVDMNDWPGRPDGAAVDARGHYWICGNDAGQIHDFDAQGQWCQSLSVPMPKPSMCAFGGAKLDQLLVTSIIPAQTTEATRGSSGSLIALQPGVQGLPEPVFSRFPASV